tara:strand:- start:199 stop:483 length:285 start_codon:yes stop_codon:yes gene_type:complete
MNELSRDKKIQITEEEQKELDELMKEITDLSKEMIEDYTKNPSKSSADTIQVNEHSPYLDEKLSNDGWKKIIKGGIDEAISFIQKKKLGKKKNK